MSSSLAVSVILSWTWIIYRYIVTDYINQEFDHSIRSSSIDRLITLNAPIRYDSPLKVREQPDDRELFEACNDPRGALQAIELYIDSH